MNLKRAIGAGLLVFAIQFSLVSVVSNIAGPFLGQSQTLNYAWQALMVFLLASIVFCVSLWYFKSSKVNVAHGAALGALMVVTSFVVNLLQTIPALYFGQDILGPLKDYVMSIPFGITVGINIVAAIFAAYMKRRGANPCNVGNAVGTYVPEMMTEEVEEESKS